MLLTCFCCGSLTISIDGYCEQCGHTDPDAYAQTCKRELALQFIEWLRANPESSVAYGNHCNDYPSAWETFAGEEEMPTAVAESFNAAWGYGCDGWESFPDFARDIENRMKNSYV